MSLPHRFVCLSDVEVPCERIPLAEDWHGWWAKMALYRALTGPVLYLDLDSLVVGDLAPLVRTTPGFTMVQDFYHPDCGNSCALSWLGDYSRLTDAFAAASGRLARQWDKAPHALIGDQGFVHRSLGDVDWFDPARVVSFKKSARNGAPEDARVICYHGVPKPNDPRAGWSFQAWRAL